MQNIYITINNNKKKIYIYNNNKKGNFYTCTHNYLHVFRFTYIYAYVQTIMYCIASYTMHK